MDIGRRLAIVPSWEQYDTDRTVITLDPGMAFGTGTHETTALCLSLIHIFRAEGVDVRLYDHIRQRHDRRLHARGHAQRDDAPQHGPVEADAPPVEPPCACGFGELAQRQVRAQRLADDGGEGGAAHAPVEARDEHEVQHLSLIHI